MKATTEQLSKVDFSKCKLPDFRGLKVHAAKAPVGPFPYIEAEWYIPVATRSVDEPYTWDTRRATTEELAQIVARKRRRRRAHSVFSPMRGRIGTGITCFYIQDQTIAAYSDAPSRSPSRCHAPPKCTLSKRRRCRTTVRAKSESRRA